MNTGTPKRLSRWGTFTLFNPGMKVVWNTTVRVASTTDGNPTEMAFSSYLPSRTSLR